MNVRLLGLVISNFSLSEMPMPSNIGTGKYLHECLCEFPTICKLKYGVEFDLVSVEQKVQHLRRRTPLTYPDLKYFESPEHWWFQRFWVFPPRERIEPALEKETFDKNGSSRLLKRKLLTSGI